jgi:MFS family permease
MEESVQPDIPNGVEIGRIRQNLNKTFKSLRNRNFKLYFRGQIISNTGNWLTNVALTLLVLKITHSGLDVGLMAACQFGPILFLSAWAGALADRKNKRSFLLLTQSLEMAESVGLAILAFMHHPPLAGLYILATLGGIFLAFDNPLRRSFVSEMVPQEDLSNAVVLYSTIVNTSRIFGPAIAGALAVTVGYGWCFSLDAASYLAVIYSLYIMNVKELIRLPIKPKQKGEVRAGLRYIRDTPQLWISFVMLAIVGTLANNFQVTIPLFVSDSLHKTTAVYTILYSVFSLGAVISSFYVAQRSLVKIKHIIIGALALGTAMFIFALTPNLAFSIPAAFLVGLTTILFNTAITTMVQVETKPEIRGRVLSLQTVLMIGTTPIGGPILGYVADISGGRFPIIIGATACIVAGTFGYFANQRLIN